MSSEKKPNILFLMSDQQRSDSLGCLNGKIKTPNLDALKEEGKLFSETVCNVPMCVPSRYSMMSGLYGYQLGVKHNAQMIPNDESLQVPVLAQRLKDAGYQTGGFGKTHWYIGSGVMPGVTALGTCRGFEHRSIQGRSTDSNNFEVGAKYMADDEPVWFEQLIAQSATAGPGGESVVGYIGDTSPVPSDHHLEGWLTRQALHFLDTERDLSRPFFLYLSLDYPHVAFFVPKEFEAMYDIKDFILDDEDESIPPGHRSGDRFESIWCELNKEQKALSRLRYAALCTFVDHCFGRVISKLKSKGEWENTFVLFTSDHGDMLGDRGRVSKYCLYDGSVRVPLIIAGPRVSGVNQIDKRPCELVDVVPTLLDVAGVDIPEYLPGVSLLSDFNRLGAFAEMHGRGYEEYQRGPTFMWRNAEWKLIITLPGKLDDIKFQYDIYNGELYDLVSDPLEVNNLYDSSKFSSKKQELMSQLLLHTMSSLGRYPHQTTRSKIKITGPETKPDSSIWAK